MNNIDKIFNSTIRRVKTMYDSFNVREFLDSNPEYNNKNFIHILESQCRLFGHNNINEMNREEVDVVILDYNTIKENFVGSGSIAFADMPVQTIKQPETQEKIKKRKGRRQKTKFNNK